MLHVCYRCGEIQLKKTSVVYMQTLALCLQRCGQIMSFDLQSRERSITRCWRFYTRAIISAARRLARQTRHCQAEIDASSLVAGTCRPGHNTPAVFRTAAACWRRHPDRPVGLVLRLQTWIAASPARTRYHRRVGIRPAEDNY